MQYNPHPIANTDDDGMMALGPVPSHKGWFPPSPPPPDPWGLAWTPTFPFWDRIIWP